MGRLLAIGDVHGCSAALAGLLTLVAPTAEDTIVTLGDYVNRGPDTQGVLTQLLELEQQCRLTPLLGNHDAMLLAARANRRLFEEWLAMGGQATLASYGAAANLDSIPQAHIDFLGRCRKWYQTGHYFFVHANYNAHVPLAEQSDHDRLWLSLRDSIPPPHESGLIAILGHTPQAGGNILDLGYLKCIDTGCVKGGRLTALDVERGTLWQVDRDGHAVSPSEPAR